MAAASVHWRIGVTLLVLGIPVLYAVAFQLAGLPFSVGMFGYGALGWYVHRATAATSGPTLTPAPLL